MQEMLEEGDGAVMWYTTEKRIGWKAGRMSDSQWDLCMFEEILGMSEDIHGHDFFLKGDDLRKSLWDNLERWDLI